MLTSITTALRRRLRLFLPVALLLAGALSPLAASAQNGGNAYILATATTGGTYYPVGVAIGTLTKLKLAPAGGPSVSAISSAGSAENVKLLRDGDAQFAILQALYGAWAWAGEGPTQSVGPQSHLRSVTGLWPNVEHFVLEADLAASGTMSDMGQLDGAAFSIGKRNSGAEGSARYVLGALGIDADSAFSPTYLGYGPSADALQNGTIVGMNTPAGVPVAAVNRAFAQARTPLTILGFSDQQLAAVNERYPLYFRYVIPAGTYVGLDRDIASAAQQNFLAVHEDVPADDVYAIVRAIYENLPFLAANHAATKAMSLENALVGLTVPLHEGALRYYREQGLDIAPALITE